MAVYGKHSTGGQSHHLVLACPMVERCDVYARRNIAVLYPELLAYARSLMRDRAAGDDLAGDAVIRALTHDNVPPAIENLRPWLFRVIRNLSIDRWRAEDVRRDYVEMARHCAQRQALATTLPEDSALGRLAFARLSRPHRDVLILIDVLGHSYEEAARLLGVPPGTVMSRVARARAAMAERVHGDLADAEEQET